MKLPAYLRTKPSGVEWLGEVPEHWEAKRLKYSASINDEALPETTLPDFEFEYVDIGGVSAVDGITATEQVVFENAPSRARRRVRQGDTIVSTVRTYLRAIAPIKNPPENLIVSTGFAVVRPRKVEPAFLAYALRESSFIESVVARSVGVSYPACNASEVGGIPIPLPDPAEQRAIAAFLDRETGRVDQLVAKKRELIERLKEKRTALISRTVTRGLPPAAARAAGLPANPSVKPSGIEWLGEIPKHWEVVPLGYLVRFSGGATPDKSNSAYWDGSIPWVSPKDMKVARIANAEDHVSSEALANSALRLMPVDSILIVVRGMILAHSFPVGLTTVPVTINQDMKAVVCGKRVTPHFLSWSFTGFAKTFVSFADESAHGTRKLETGTLTRFPFLLPPLREQAAIAAYLDEETAKLDALVGKVEAAVERLQEYRTALITAAVTGKIDVRKHVTQ